MLSAACIQKLMDCIQMNRPHMVLDLDERFLVLLQILFLYVAVEYFVY